MDSQEFYNRTVVNSLDRRALSRQNPIFRGSAVMRGWCFLLCPIVWGGGQAGAQATDASRGVQRGPEQTLQQMQQLQQLERDGLTNRALPLRKDGRAAPTDVASDEQALPGAGCWPIKKIHLSGAHQLLFRQHDELVAAYVGRCMGAKDVAQLMSDVTRFYVSQGYVTTRVYLPAQDLSLGDLELSVVEGAIEKVEVARGSAGLLNVTTAFPSLNGKVLNLRDLEQGEDQLNSLASNRASTRILPGSSVGSSVVEVSNEPQKRWHASISYDNQGAPGSGRMKAGAALTLDNPMGFNDRVSVSHQQALTQHRAQAYSETDTLIYAVPYGYNSFSLGYLRSSYNRQLLQPSGSVLDARGTSEDFFGRWDRVIFRDQNSRLTLAGTLSVKPARNYFADQLLLLTSPNLSVLDLEVAWTSALAGGVLSLDLGLARGLGIFGTQRDVSGESEEYPRAQFSKWKGALGYKRSFNLGGKRQDWSSQLVWQHSKDVLYASEQMLIGGIYTVRGFTSNTLSGENGFYLRNDFSVYLPGVIAGHQFDFKPYVGVDVGRVSQRYAGMAPSGTLKGMALGIKLEKKPLSLDIFYTHSLAMPASMTSECGAVYFRLAYAI